jgi:hypothetical protein
MSDTWELECRTLEGGYLAFQVRLGDQERGFLCTPDRRWLGPVASADISALARQDAEQGLDPESLGPVLPLSAPDNTRALAIGDGFAAVFALEYLGHEPDFLLVWESIAELFPAEDRDEVMAVAREHGMREL